jgi:hypothetical protein
MLARLAEPLIAPSPAQELLETGIGCIAYLR